MESKRFDLKMQLIKEKELMSTEMKELINQEIHQLTKNIEQAQKKFVEPTVG